VGSGADKALRGIEVLRQWGNNGNRWSEGAAAVGDGGKRFIKIIGIYYWY
jgi:hypothetical protein